MKQIKLTKGQFAIVDDEDFEYLNQFKWCLNGNYAGGRTLGRYIAMHRLIMNTPERMVVDHINGCRLDNRKENLRNCTQSQNSMNRRIEKGACFDKHNQNWRSQIVYRDAQNNKIQKYLGSYKTRAEALIAYDSAVKIYHGEYAISNKEIAQ